MVQAIFGPIERAGDLMAAESLLQVVELFPGPALVVGPGGEVVGASERAAGWLGLDRGALAGRPLAGLLADPPARVAAFLDDCRRGAGKMAGTLTSARGGGAGGPCRVEGIAISNGSGRLEATTVVVHVLDDRDAALEAMREGLRARDAMIDRMAHDLRNPAAAISSALHLVRRASAPEDVAWAGDAMERQVRSLVRQLDDLLDLARLSRGRVELQKEPLDAAATARSAASAIRPSLDDRDLRLTVSTSPGELTVVADPARLERMVAGLLGQVAGSAVPGGGLRLSVSREGDAIVFRAHDRVDEPEPAAIPPEPGPTAVDAEEPGVGMMLVRKLAEVHGGSTSFRDGGPDRGSEITVRLPAAGASSATTAGPAEERSPGAAPGARILVVDDNVDAARGTARLLEIAGYDVRVAHDGPEALEVAHGHRPRFVLLDISLPSMDGYEVARRLRADPVHREVTIIAISGYSSDDDQSPHEAGFDHHLVKPVDFNALRAILGRPAAG